MQAGPAVGPSQSFRAPGASPTFGVDPNSGRYQGAPNPMGFQGQGNSLEQATFQRGLNQIDPYLQKQRSSLAQRLANQGLPVGSEAHSNEMNRFDRSRSDALENLALSSVGAGRSRARSFVRSGSGIQAVRVRRSRKAVQGKTASYGIQRRRSR